MAGLTKEERAKREAAEKEQMRKEIEEQVRSEMASSTINDNELKKENEKLKDKLAEMMDMIKSLKSQKEEDEEKSSDKANIDTFPNADTKDVEMNARILVTSITTGGVNMKTSNDGSARHFRFEKLGQTIPVIYEHLINCINTDRWLFEDGLVYISNPNVIREQCLEEAYKKFLTPETIENIMNFDSDTIVEMLSSTTPAIQETIVDIVVEKLNSGGFVDMNKVDVISKACDVDVRELANKFR